MALATRSASSMTLGALHHIFRCASSTCINARGSMDAWSHTGLCIVGLPGSQYTVYGRVSCCRI